MFIPNKKRESNLSLKDLKQRSNGNFSEFRFIGFPRSGIRSIGYWLLSNFSGLSFFKDEPLKKVPTSKKFYKKFAKDIAFQKEYLISRSGNDVCVGFCWMDFPWRKCIKTPSVYKNRFNILVLRNIYHQVASLEKAKNKWSNEKLTAKEYVEFRYQWEDMAKSFLKKPIREKNTIRILFDQWISDGKYRKQILNALDPLPFIPIKNDNIFQRSLSTPFDVHDPLNRFENMSNVTPMSIMHKDKALKFLTKKLFK